MRTIFVKKKDITQKWYVINAEGKTLGRVAAKVIPLLRGKNKPYYTPHLEVGDKVVIINADKIRVSGKKLQQKLYYRHTGYPGGIKLENLAKRRQRKPTFPLEHAIKGMLPKGRLGRKLFRNVKIYAGSEHPHSAQMPEVLDI
jgi:large subunit ribosomal protein L13